MFVTFDLTKPSHLLENLAHEMAKFGADLNDSYTAINALRDAYHLREWVWHNRLQPDPALQAEIMGKAGDTDNWNSWVYQQFSGFLIVRDLCKGLKHLERGDKVKAYYKADSSGKMSISHNFKLYDPGFYVKTDEGVLMPVNGLVKDAYSFWRNLFKSFPQLNCCKPNHHPQ